jgi:hypothetical protein
MKEVEQLLNIGNQYKIIKFEEGLNNKIKVIKRVAFGYRNFRFFRLRLMYILNGKVSGMTKKDRNAKK